MQVEEWLPQFDAFKIEKGRFLGRIKDMDIWVDFKSSQADWLETLTPEMTTLIHAWSKSHR